jgi:hypothetical protein
LKGWKVLNWNDDDYAVVDDTMVGRIYREMIHGKDKWLWSLLQIPEAGPGRPIPLAQSRDDRHAGGGSGSVPEAL